MSRDYRGPEVGTITASFGRLDRIKPGLLSWATVRVFGELQILNRASFAMLIVVPVLSALWPNVQVLINQYNESLRIMITHLELLNSEIVATDEPLAVQETIAEVARQISETINPIRERVSESATLKQNLPTVWVVAFFSSLSAVLAQVIYQSQSPPMVKSFGLREFVDTSFETETRIDSDRPTSGKQIDSFVQECVDQYINTAKLKPWRCAASFVLYALTLIGIAWIIIGQSFAVLRAAGFLSAS